MTDVSLIYDACAAQFDRDRSRALMEEAYLRAVLAELGGARDVLDLGCGMSEPIARYFIDAGCQVTGIDAAPAMLVLCRERFPGMTWLEGDMRILALGHRFAAAIAWDSFFHLTADQQRRMFPIFAAHSGPRGLLLFTSGPRAGTALGDFYGHPLYHAILAAAEYRQLLAANGFEVLLHRVEDPRCGRHTVWLARQRA